MLFVYLLPTTQSWTGKTTLMNMSIPFEYVFSPISPSKEGFEFCSYFFHSFLFVLVLSFFRLSSFSCAYDISRIYSIHFLLGLFCFSWFPTSIIFIFILSGFILTTWPSQFNCVSLFFLLSLLFCYSFDVLVFGFVPFSFHNYSATVLHFRCVYFIFARSSFLICKLLSVLR